MIKFELKKLYKQKKIIILLLFSILIAFYANHITTILGNTRYKYSQVDKKSMTLVSFKLTELSVFNLDKFDEDTKKEFDKDLKELDKYAFVDIPEKYKNDSNYISELRYNHISSSEYMRKKYDIKLDDNDLKNWKWTLFDNEYSKQNNVNSTSLPDSKISNNYARQFIHTADLTLGFPIIFLFIILFSNIISKENEENTSLFLQTQPLSYRKIILSKFASLLICSILYLIFVFLTTFVVFTLINGISFTGFREIYRVINKNIISYINSIRLIGKIILSYFAMMIFSSSLIILISSRVRNTIKTIGSILMFYFLLFVFTQKMEILQNNFNPIYMMDYLKVILGNIEIKYVGYLTENIEKLSSGLLPYIIYFIISLFFISISCLKLEKRHTIKEIKLRKNKNINLFNFEKIKITKQNGFIFYISCVVIIFVSMFIIDVSNNKNAESFLLSKEIIKQNKNFLEQNKKAYNDEKNAKNDIYKAIEESYLSEIRINENINDGYVNHDSKLYYENLNKNQEKLYNKSKDDILMHSYKFDFLKYSTLSNASYIENLALNEYSKNNISPLIRDYHISKFDEFINSDYENIIRNTNYVKSNSAIQNIQNFIELKNFNLQLIILSFLIIFLGYAYDKDKGNQIEFMFTQPIKRTKYNLYKLLSSVVVFIIITLAILSSLFIIGMIFEGLGEINYPIIHYDTLINPNQAFTENNLYFHIIPVWKYIFTNVGMLTLQSIFISCLTIFISIFSNKKLNVAFYTISIITVGIFITKLIPIESIKLVLPFTHFNAKEIADGSIRITQALTNYRTIYSVISLVSWSVLLFVLSNIFIKKNR
ncbi:ABC transporter permease [Helcococcus kunzii]|uniref:ABC transporter permease n=1 Tax=Helcococcus kunzii TaxID=40091 RepID=UPI0038B08EF7